MDNGHKKIISFCGVMIMVMIAKAGAQQFGSNKGAARYGVEAGGHIVFFDGVMRHIEGQSDSIGGEAGFSSTGATAYGLLVALTADWTTFGTFGVGLSFGYQTRNVEFASIASIVDADTIREDLSINTSSLDLSPYLNMELSPSLSLRVGVNFGFPLQSKAIYLRGVNGVSSRTDKTLSNVRPLNVGLASTLQWVIFDPVALSIYTSYGQNWLRNSVQGDRIGLLSLGAAVGVRL